ncbi:MAG: hypothetical protein V3R27_08705 [Pseudomonadales bacterium]
MSELETFREATRAWLAENSPKGARGPGPISNGSTKIKITDTDTLLWLERMVETMAVRSGGVDLQRQQRNSTQYHRETGFGVAGLRGEKRCGT